MFSVNVVMRTFNNDDIVGQTLSALFSQINVKCELLVIDSGSTDKTLDILKKYPHNLIEIKNTEYIPGKVLNMGAKKSKTSNVVFLNSDTVMLEKDTLYKLCLDFENNNLDAAYARQVARPDAFPEVKESYLKSFPILKQDKPNWITLSAPLMIIKKDVVLDNPFYDKSWGSEDTELGKRLIEKGYNVDYISKALVMHSHNYTLKQLFNRSFVEGEANAFIYNEKFSYFKLLKNILKKVLSFGYVNFKYKSLRCFNILYPISEVLGYSKGLRVAMLRKKENNKELNFVSYQ